MWGLSCLIRDHTHVLCIGRLILNPWTTREVPGFRRGGERPAEYDSRPLNVGARAHPNQLTAVTAATRLIIASTGLN